mmetsp:Transcript_73527/g.137383  ORF Transcript_73527/g.137383 Transcript_73527/m.137383 type:complete len:358 (+) Transcript_73527:65-1138(+)
MEAQWTRGVLLLLIQLCGCWAWEGGRSPLPPDIAAALQKQGFLDEEEFPPISPCSRYRFPGKAVLEATNGGGILRGHYHEQCSLSTCWQLKGEEKGFCLSVAHVESQLIVPLKGKAPLEASVEVNASDRGVDCIQLSFDASKVEFPHLEVRGTPVIGWVAPKPGDVIAVRGTTFLLSFSTVTEATKDQVVTQGPGCFPGDSGSIGCLVEDGWEKGCKAIGILKGGTADVHTIPKGNRTFDHNAQVPDHYPALRLPTGREPATQCVFISWPVLMRAKCVPEDAVPKVQTLHDQLQEVQRQLHEVEVQRQVQANEALEEKYLLLQRCLGIGALLVGLLLVVFVVFVIAAVQQRPKPHDP